MAPTAHATGRPVPCVSRPPGTSGWRGGERSESPGELASGTLRLSPAIPLDVPEELATRRVPGTKRVPRTLPATQRFPPFGPSRPACRFQTGANARRSFKDRPKNSSGTVPVLAQRRWDRPLPKSGSCSSAAPKGPAHVWAVAAGREPEYDRWHGVRTVRAGARRPGVEADAARGQAPCRREAIQAINEGPSVIWTA